MSKKAKLIRFTLFKLIEYLPLFLSELTRRFLFEPIFFFLVATGASEETKNLFALKIVTLPSPPIWLVFVFVALTPSLLVALTMKAKKALGQYILFATVVDFVLSGLILMPYLMGITGDLGKATAGLIAMMLAGGLLVARVVGLLIGFIWLKLEKSLIYRHRLPTD